MTVAKSNTKNITVTVNMNCSTEIRVVTKKKLKRETTAEASKVSEINLHKTRITIKKVNNRLFTTRT